MYVFPLHRFATVFVQQIRCKQRKMRFASTLLEGTACVIVALRWDRVWPCRPEIELMIADGNGVIPKCIVCSDDRCALVEIRFQRALPHIAGVDQQDFAAIMLTDVAQYANEGGQPGQPAEPALSIELPMNVVGANQGKRRGGRCGLVCASAGDDQQQGGNGHGTGHRGRLYRALCCGFSRA